MLASSQLERKGISDVRDSNTKMIMMMMIIIIIIIIIIMIMTMIIIVISCKASRGFSIVLCSAGT